MTETLSKFTDTLVTRDVLDTRLMEQKTYMGSKFAAVDERFSQIESKLVQMKAATDIGFSRLENRINILFLLVGLVLTVQVIPALKTLFAG